MGKKSKPRRAGPSAMQIANIAGVSLTLVHRKLAQGKTPRQIIFEAVAREHEMVQDLPTVPVNGHAAADGLVSFAEAQRRKEHALARIREAEADERTGELMPTEQARSWLAHIFVPLVNGMRGIPEEMRDLLGPEMTELLRRRVESCIACADQYLVACHERAGKPLSDGALDAGNGYRIEWRIIPPPPEAA
jgi:hypothetical protein